MRNRQQSILAAAFFVTGTVAGIPYWQIPYAKAGLPDSIFGLGLLIAFFASAIIRYALHIPLVRVCLTIGIAIPTVVMLRVIVEVARDPTSHNLWPLEIIIAAAIGLGVSFLGALLGTGASFLVRRCLDR